MPAAMPEGESWLWKTTLYFCAKSSCSEIDGLVLGYLGSLLHELEGPFTGDLYRLFDWSRSQRQCKFILH